MWTDAKTLTLSDFAKLWGTEESKIPEASRSIIESHDWAYRRPTLDEYKMIVLDFLKRIDHKQFSIVVEGDKERWLQGWGENLQAYIESGDEDALVPRYIRPDLPIRLNGEFVYSRNPEFELKWYEAFRGWLFENWLGGFDHAFEFGCGSGFNVAALADRYPETHVTGLDWAQPSVDIVERLRETSGRKVAGRLFDFFNPDHSLDIPSNSVVFTIGALEQTGTSHTAFFDFLLEKKPSLCVHVEPIYDWYDENNLDDRLAIKAHELRNFWRGIIPRLKQLEADGKIEIIKENRAYFGSLVLEGYSQLFWRPL